MRRIVFAFALFVGLTSWPNVRSLGGDAKTEPGFTSLFNGKNLDGWQLQKNKESLAGKTVVGEGRFKVADGLLTISPTEKKDLFIETTRDFTKDVVLKLEFKAGPGCNNDIYLRGTKFDLVLGKKDAANAKEGEWSTVEIIVKGDSVEHKVNGQSARKSMSKSASSKFAIRAEFGSIQFKNIQFKE